MLRQKKLAAHGVSINKVSMESALGSGKDVGRGRLDDVVMYACELEKVVCFGA